MEIELEYVQLIIGTRYTLNNNNNNNLTCKAPVCAKKRLQWRWRTELVAEVKCLRENVCLWFIRAWYL